MYRRSLYRSKRVRSHELVTRAGVSQATLTRAFASSIFIAKSTLEKVLEDPDRGSCCLHLRNAPDHPGDHCVPEHLVEGLGAGAVKG